MSGIINNDSLDKDHSGNDGIMTNTPATQNVGQGADVAKQTTDANQNSGGEGNLGVSQQNNEGSDGADGKTSTTPTYLADWGTTTFSDAVKNGEKSIADYMGDYNRWASANKQEPLDVFTMMQVIQGNDVSQSYEANEKQRKRLERQQRWEQIGNVLNHLGNFVGALSGAPAATYESPGSLTKRQQSVRDAVLKQHADPKDILALIWKDRADQRSKELNDANVALQEARKANVEGQTTNQKAVADANVVLRGAQANQAEAAAQANQARAEYTNSQNRRADELQPFKKQQIKSSISANNARASASRAQANVSNKRAYGTDYAANRYKIWAKNRRLHPNESRQFMLDNNIHSFDKKNWTPSLVDQYNGYIADKFNRSSGSAGNVSDLLD